MTREEIMGMEQGPELDAAVAEVFGYKAYREKRGEWNLCVVQKPGEREPWSNRQRPDPERYEQITCKEAAMIGFYGTGFPKYSTSIAAAWEVVEKMDDCLHIKQHGECGNWQAYFCGYQKSKACGHTAPEAICKAALLSMID